jgi:hypothetical protein
MKTICTILDYVIMVTALWLFFQAMGVAHQVDEGLISKSLSSGQRRGR